ncbi:hypothetical protein N665_0680s0006 [Sinapis alba]|nr:hypothetical protein N665_0680s0006 [Sinapis alba]
MGEAGADFVVESTGVFPDKDKAAAHLSCTTKPLLQRKKAMCHMFWTMGQEFSLEVLKKQRKLWLVGSAVRKTNYIKCQRMLLSWRSLR